MACKHTGMGKWRCRAKTRNRNAVLPQQGQWIRAEDILCEPKLTQIRTVANTNDALWAMLASVDCRIDFNAEIVVSLTKNY